MKKFLIIAILALSEAACAVSGSPDIVAADGVANHHLVRVGNIETPLSAEQAASYVSRSTSIR